MMNDPDRTGAYTPETADAPGVNAAPAQQPQQIGRYRIERVLGKGGFGIVYLAHDGQLQRLVAIKVPHRKLVDCPEAAEAYLTEARTVANLDHPNIVPVHDVGSTDDLPCYVVSKYIDGTDLATRLKQSRLSIHETVELVATVAEALHHAHKQGLVHRDIKPGNLLLDKSGKPFVADFGLALREQDVGSLPTHASDQCVSACRYLATVLAALIHGEDRDEVLSPEWQPLQQLNAIKPLHPMIQEIAQGNFRQKQPPAIQGSGWVVKSLEASLWAFHDADTFEEAVLARP